MFNVVPEFSETPFIFRLFSLFCSASVISTYLSSTSLIRSSAFCILLLAASNKFLISVIVLYLVSLCSVFPVNYSSLSPVYFQCLGLFSALIVFFLEAENLMIT